MCADLVVCVVGFGRLCDFWGGLTFDGGLGWFCLTCGFVFGGFE